MVDHGEWMKTLEPLGITYRKAQYWMHIVRMACRLRDSVRDEPGDREREYCESSSSMAGAADFVYCDAAGHLALGRLAS